jgi:hypothetical protein
MIYPLGFIGIHGCNTPLLRAGQFIQKLTNFKTNPAGRLR